MSSNIRFSQAQPQNKSIWFNIRGVNVLLSVYKGVRGAILYFNWSDDGVADVYNENFKKIGTYDVYKQGEDNASRD